MPWPWHVNIADDPDLMLGKQFKAQVAKTTLNRIIPLGNNPVEITFQVSERLRTEHVYVGSRY